MKLRNPTLALTALTVSLATGCGTATFRQPARVGAAATSTVQGNVHGGQQPVSGANVQVWVMGSTGDGSASTAVLTQSVQSDGNGNFDLTGKYICSDTDQVYVTATGGDPGLGTGVNPQLALMTAPGTCAQLKAMNFLSINELTTVAAVSKLAPYMDDYQHIGYDSTDATQLAADVAEAALLVDPSAGQAGVATLPAGATINVPLINTLADALAACVNSSGGVAGDGSVCGNLLSYTTVARVTPPTNTADAMFYIAARPQRNITQIIGLASATSPFQPTVTAAPVSLTAEVSQPGIVGDDSSISEGYDSYGNRILTLKIENTSNVALALASLAFSQNSSPNYPSIIGADTQACPAVLSAGDACSYDLAVVTAALSGRGTVVITDGNGRTNRIHIRAWVPIVVATKDNYITEPMSGNTIPIVSCVRNTCDHPYEASLVIKNLSNQTVNLTTQITTGYSFSGAPTQLAAGETVTMIVHAPVDSSGVITFTDSVTNQVSYISLGPG